MRTGKANCPWLSSKCEHSVAFGWKQDPYVILCADVDIRSGGLQIQALYWTCEWEEFKTRLAVTKCLLLHGFLTVRIVGNIKKGTPPVLILATHRQTTESVWNIYGFSVVAVHMSALQHVQEIHLNQSVSQEDRCCRHLHYVSYLTPAETLNQPDNCYIM